METALAAGGMVLGILLKVLFQTKVMGWLRKPPHSWWKRLLLYGERPATNSDTAAGKPQQVG